MQSLYDQFNPPEFDPSLMEYSNSLSPMGNPIGMELIQKPVGSPMAQTMLSKMPRLRAEMSGQTPDMPSFKNGTERAVFMLRGQSGLDKWRETH